MPTWYGSGKRKSQGIPSRGTVPYQKNDNRHVEQKNDTLVRQYLGELRLDTPEQIAAGNALYEQTNLLQLRDEIYAVLDALWETAVAQNGTAA